MKILIAKQAKCIVYMTIEQTEIRSAKYPYRVISDKEMIQCKGCVVSDPQGKENAKIATVPEMLHHLTIHVNQFDLPAEMVPPAIKKATEHFGKT